MGSTFSLQNDNLSSNELLMKYISNENIRIDDPFWEEFFSFEPPVTFNMKPITKIFGAFFKHMISHQNPICTNQKTLILVLCLMIEKTSAQCMTDGMLESNIKLRTSTINGFFATRCLLSLGQLHFDDAGMDFIFTLDHGINSLVILVERMLQLVTILNNSPPCTKLFEEIVCLFIHLFSTGYRYPKFVELVRNTIFSPIYANIIPIIVLKLLHVIEVDGSCSMLQKHNSGYVYNFLANVAYAPISLLQQITGFSSKSKTPPNTEYSSLVLHSMILFQFLYFLDVSIPVSHVNINGTIASCWYIASMDEPKSNTSDSQLSPIDCSSDSSNHNDSVSIIIDSKPPEPKELNANPNDGVTINFAHLTKCFIKNMNCEVSVTSFSIMLYCNPRYLHFLISGPYLQEIVMKLLINLNKKTDQWSYMAHQSLICLSLLSSQPYFGWRLDKIIVHSVSWFMEYSLADISVTCLMIIVVIKALKTVLFHSHYEHYTLFMSTLVNTAHYWSGIHFRSSEVIVSWLELLIRKRARIHANSTSEQISSENSISIPINSDLNQQKMDPNHSTVDDILLLTLDAICACLQNNLSSSQFLIHRLMIFKEKEKLCQLKSYSVYQDSVNNLLLVIDFFSSSAEKIIEQNGQFDDPSQVPLMISEVFSLFPLNLLKRIPNSISSFVLDPEMAMYSLYQSWKSCCNYMKYCHREFVPTVELLKQDIQPSSPEEFLFSRIFPNEFFPSGRFTASYIS